MIFFLGTDCSGKNSVMHELAKVLEYKPFMSPRSPICNIVYDRLYKRNKECEKFNMFLISKLLKLGTYFVLVQAQSDILEQRAKARNEQHVKSQEDFKKHIRLYNKVFSLCKESFPQYKHRFLKIDNSKELNSTTKKLEKLLIKSYKTEKISMLLRTKA